MLNLRSENFGYSFLQIVSMYEFNVGSDISEHYYNYSYSLISGFPANAFNDIEPIFESYFFDLIKFSVLFNS